MKTNIYGKNIKLTDGLKNSVNEKLGRLDKFFTNELEAKVVLSVEKSTRKVEVTIPFNNKIVRVEELDKDMYNAIDKAVESLERQLKKYKGKLQDRAHSNESIRFENIDVEESEEEPEFKIVKIKKISIKPMTVEEAILQMNLLGHDFFIFLNGDTEETSLVYKRKNENYGLIDIE